MRSFLYAHSIFLVLNYHEEPRIAESHKLSTVRIRRIGDYEAAPKEVRDTVHGVDMQRLHWRRTVWKPMTSCLVWDVRRSFGCRVLV